MCLIKSKNENNGMSVICLALPLVILLLVTSCSTAWVSSVTLSCCITILRSKSLSPSLSLIKLWSRQAHFTITQALSGYVSVPLDRIRHFAYKIPNVYSVHFRVVERCLLKLPPCRVRTLCGCGPVKYFSRGQAYSPVRTFGTFVLVPGSSYQVGR